MPEFVAKLALEDGTVFTGTAFGAAALVEGEVVFNTSLSGYQEILTDPSYKGQIVTMTYPQIGNYGIADETDYESARPQAEGFIIKELSKIDSNFRSVESLHCYLERYGIPGIAGIDTRALVRKLRIQGALKGVLCTDQKLVGDDAELVRRANAWAGMAGMDLVKVVMPAKAYEWSVGKGTWALPKDHAVAADGSGGVRGGGDRLRVEAEHFAEFVPIRGERDGGAGGDIGGGDFGAQAGRGICVERAGGSGAGALCAVGIEEADREEADLRDLPGASVAGAGDGGADVQAEVRPSRRKSAGTEHGDGEGGDHVAESWVCGGGGESAKGRG
jgi:hypothetical protein